MPTYVPKINISWPKGNFIDLGEYETEKEAEQVLTKALEANYPGKWTDNGGQFTHVNGRAGLYCLGWVKERLTDIENAERDVEYFEERLKSAREHLAALKEQLQKKNKSR